MAHMMEQWTEAISRYGDFRQQMDPLTGDFTRIDSSGYSPAALVFFDYSQRLGGPRVEGEDLEWNVRPSTFAAGTRFVRTLKDKRIAEMIYLGTAVDFKLGGRHLLRAQGNVRLLTDMTGRITGAVGSSQAMQKVTLIAPSGKTHRLTLKPNQRVSFAFET
jgi:hypothetical protein